MEHRIDVRRSISFTVKLTDTSNATHKYRVKNLSEGGICILNPDDRLRAGDYVTVHLDRIKQRLHRVANISTHLSHCYLHALVVHVNDKEAGLMWESGNVECLEIIPHLMMAA